MALAVVIVGVFSPASIRSACRLVTTRTHRAKFSDSPPVVERPGPALARRSRHPAGCHRGARAELPVELLPREAQRSLEGECPVREPEVQVEAERRPLHRLEDMQVNRYRVRDDLVEKLLPELDRAVPQHGRVGLLRVPPEQRPITRSVRPPRVRRALGGAVDLGLPVAAGGAGCPGAGRDASFGGPVTRATGIVGFGSS